MNKVNTGRKFVELAECDDGIRFSVIVSGDATLGSRSRKKDLVQLVRRLVRSAKPSSLQVSERDVSAMFAKDTPEATLQYLVDDVDEQVAAFRRQRLHPRVVDELLAITAHERRRWIKDGRLPISGNGSFRRGRQVIQFPLHPPCEIARLMHAPEVIAKWREMDERQAMQP